MKKLLIIFLALISVVADAQIQAIDTAKVRPFALRAKDWGFVAGFASEHVSDTLYTDFYDVLKAYNRANPNVSGNTLVSFDSVPAKIIINAYKEWKQARADDVETNANRLSVKVEAITNAIVADRITEWKAQISSAYDTRWKMGARYIKY